MNGIMQFLNRIRGRQDLALVLIIMTSVVVMIIPLPTEMIDLLIAVNISLTILILMVAIYLSHPTAFSTFPAVILIATTFRLAISISTTRTILTEAEGGAIIDTFGNFVTGGNLVVGMVIFLIITIVQFVVITRGAERVAEVSARFVLDALPGRQMSIDAELRSGDITQEEARRRRKMLDIENQFFGAMDGAMKFVKGDAIAGLLIILVNLIGGITIGSAQKGMSLGEASVTYSLLTIGDGLVTQIPALLLALCAGAVVTRVSSSDSSDLGHEIAREISSSHRSIMVAGFVVIGVSFVPGFPRIMFLTLGALLMWLSWYLARHPVEALAPAAAAGAGAGTTRSAAAAAAAAHPAPPQAGAAAPAKGEELVTQTSATAQDRLLARVGNALDSRLDRAAFASARTAVMQSVQSLWGFMPPKFGVLPDSGLTGDSFRVELDGVALFASTIPAGMVAVDAEPAVLELAAVESTALSRNWPVKRAAWVKAADVARLKNTGARILSPTELIVETISGIIRKSSGGLVGFEEVQMIMAGLRQDHPQLSDQIANAYTPAKLLDIIRRLVDEHVPIVPHRAMFEALAEQVGREDDPILLAEHVRRAMRRQLCNALADENRTISGYVVEPDLEDSLRNALRATEAGIFLMLGGHVAAALMAQIQMIKAPADPTANPPVIVTAVDLRRHLRGYLKSHDLNYPVLAFQELAAEFHFQPVGTLSTAMPSLVRS